MNGDDNDNVFLATANAEPFFGFGGIDTVSYANAPAVSGVNGVAVSLLAPAKNTGFAARDTFNSIENLIGSAFKDKLVGDAGNNILEGGSAAMRSMAARASIPQAMPAPWRAWSPT